MTRLNPYKQRYESLVLLEFKTYAAYLSSELWKGIRARVLENANHICCHCRERAGSVHHGAYDLPTMRGESLAALFAVCGRCHREAEYYGRGVVHGWERLNAATVWLVSGAERTRYDRAARLYAARREQSAAHTRRVVRAIDVHVSARTTDMTPRLRRVNG